MQVRMLTSLSSEEGAWHNGDVYECPAAEGKRLIDLEMAEPVAPTPPIEAAVRRAPRARP